MASKINIEPIEAWAAVQSDKAVLCCCLFIVYYIYTAAIGSGIFWFWSMLSGVVLGVLSSFAIILLR